MAASSAAGFQWVDQQFRWVEGLAARGALDDWAPAVAELGDELLMIQGEHGAGLVSHVEEMFDQLISPTDRRPEHLVREMAALNWSLATRMFVGYTKFARMWRGVFPRIPHGRCAEVCRSIIAELDDLAERLRQLLLYVAVSAPEWELEIPAHLAAEIWTVRVSPLAYLRAMVNLFWSAIRHPLSDTTIDLSTGRVLYRT